MLASAALIPPCAATVCERVGNSLVIHAVLNPDDASPNAARRPAPPAPTTTASKVWSTMGYSDEAAAAAAGACDDAKFLFEKSCSPGRAERGAEGTSEAADPSAGARRRMSADMSD